MNPDAGRGNWLLVTLQLADGEALPFIVDTGSPVTLLDRQLELKLGKRLETGSLQKDNHKLEAGVYAAPELRLGSTPLATGPTVVTVDFQRLFPQSHRHIAGILGMDCLRHYCLQLDFEAGVLRFLPAPPADAAGLGKAFALAFSMTNQDDNVLIRPYIQHAGLAGTNTDLLIDTGDDTDGYAQRNALPGRHWLHFLHPNRPPGEIHLARCTWDGETYTRLIVGTDGENENALGLRFLARHLVTLDFPDKIMYLKVARHEPLPPVSP